MFDNQNNLSDDEWHTKQRAKKNSVYAHPWDENAIQIMRHIIINDELREEITRQIDFYYSDYMKSGLPITAEVFPRIYNVLVACARELYIRIPYAIVGQQMKGQFSAFTIGTDKLSYLVISPRLTGTLNDSELTFVIGHECGHIALEHVLYHTLMETNFQFPDWSKDLAKAATQGFAFRIIQKKLAQKMSSDDSPKLAQVILAGWKRRSEISADRAGLLCNRDLPSAERVLLMSAFGDTTISKGDIEYYLEAIAYEEKPSFMQQLWLSYPDVLKRIQALRIFANSEDYYSLTGEQKPNHKLYKHDDIIKITNQIIGI